MAAILLLAVFFAYRPAASGGFIWDDDDYVSQNPTLLNLSGLADIWLHPTLSPQYYPMVFTTFWLESQLGNGPHGFHEINILLHAASAILLWRILRRLKLPGAYLAALIFAVHPVMVESVAWITERKNVLSLFFYLASFYAYLRLIRIDEPENSLQRFRPGWYTAALTFFLLALLSKTVTASLPTAILLILWWKHGRLTIKDITPLLPFFLLGIAASLVTSHIEHSAEGVGASGAEWNYSVAQRVLIAGRAVWFYAAKLIWPGRLTFIYPKWEVEPAVAWQWIFPISLLALLVVLFVLRRRIGRGPLVAVLFFVGTLVPALGFVNVFPMRYTFVADHYQYHAGIGMIVLVVVMATMALHRSAVRRRFPLAGPVAAALIFAALFTITLSQSSIYKNQLTLWADTTAKNPDSWMPWTRLGVAYRSAQPPDLAKTAVYMRKALALAPDVADTHFEMGQCLIDESDYPAAIAELKRATEIEPRYTQAYNLIGFALRQMNQLDQAIPFFEKALSLNPRYYQAHFNLGRIYKDKGRHDTAIEHFKQSLAINPAQPQAWFQLGHSYGIKGQRDLAVTALEEGLKLQPDDAEAHFNLATVLRGMGREQDANLHLARAITLKPELGELLKRPR